MKQEIITILIVLGLMILLIWITFIKIANRYFNKRMNSKSSKGIPDYTSSDVGGGFGGGD